MSEENKNYRESLDRIVKMLAQGPQIIIPKSVMRTKYLTESKTMFGSIIYEMTQNILFYEINEDFNSQMANRVKELVAKKSVTDIMIEGVCDSEKKVDTIRKQVTKLADEVDFTQIFDIERIKEIQKYVRI